MVHGGRQDDTSMAVIASRARTTGGAHIAIRNTTASLISILWLKQVAHSEVVAPPTISARGLSHRHVSARSNGAPRHQASVGDEMKCLGSMARVRRYASALLLERNKFAKPHPATCSTTASSPLRSLLWPTISEDEPAQITSIWVAGAPEGGRLKTKVRRTIFLVGMGQRHTAHKNQKKKKKKAIRVLEKQLLGHQAGIDERKPLLATSHSHKDAASG